jgi:hypothetical protein
VDEGDCEVVATVELTEEAEEAGDIGGGVFIEAVKSDEGIEDQEPGLEGSEGVIEGDLIALEVEAETGSGDDVEVEAGEGEAAVVGELVDAVAELGEGVLGEIDDGGSRGIHLEVAEAGGAGSHRDGEVEAEPGFAGLGRATNDADGRSPPELPYKPAHVLWLGVDGMNREGGQGGGHGQRDLRPAMTSPEETVAAPA